MFVYLLLCTAADPGRRGCGVSEAYTGRVPKTRAAVATASHRLHSRPYRRAAVMCNRPSDDGAEPGCTAAADSTQANYQLNRYRLHLYNYALQAERLRLTGAGWGTAVCPPTYHVPGACPPRFPVALFHPVGPGALQNGDDPKPQHSYIGLIAMAILGSAEGKLVLSDIYQYILDNYPYFRARGPGWRNSIRHNLSLNDCFVKAGRSANGKGHYWAIHPANVDDFKKGDFRRRKAQRKVRRHMGLAVDDDGNDSPSPPPPPPQLPPQHQLHGPLPPSAWTPPLMAPQPGGPHQSSFYFQPVVQHAPRPMQLLQQLQQSAAPAAQKRQFDVASLLAPDPPKRPRNDPAATTATTGSSEDEDEMTTCSVRGQNGGAGGWESVGLLQRYYEHQLQAAHRLHAIRQTLDLHRMIGVGGGVAGPWPTAVIVQDRNAMETPTPPPQSYCTAATTPDDSIKTELVD